MSEIGDKYIIEISDKLADGLYKIKGFNTLVFDEYGLGRLEKLSDGWDVARRIAQLDDNKLLKIFGTSGIGWILTSMTAKEAQNAIDKYEQTERSKDLSFGDMFVNLENGEKVVVIDVTWDISCVTVINISGDRYRISVEDLFEKYDKVNN